MIYAIDEYRSELVEFKSTKELDKENDANRPRLGNDKYRRVTAERAHKWVRDGYVHMTGLYVDGGRVRYARGE